jgi:hypothetical protein
MCSSLNEPAARSASGIQLNFDWIVRRLGQRARFAWRVLGLTHTVAVSTLPKGRLGYHRRHPPSVALVAAAHNASIAGEPSTSKARSAGDPVLLGGRKLALWISCRTSGAITVLTSGFSVSSPTSQDSFGNFQEGIAKAATGDSTLLFTVANEVIANLAFSTNPPDNASVLLVVDIAAILETLQGQPWSQALPSLRLGRWCCSASRVVVC